MENSAVELHRLAKQLNGVVSSLRVRGDRALANTGNGLVEHLRKNSPVYTGLYQSRWVGRLQRPAPVGFISQVIITNTTPYGIYMEIGSEKGQPPWPIATAKWGGRLVEMEGRIWSSTSPGGVIKRTFEEFDFDNLAKNVADQLFGTL